MKGMILKGLVVIGIVIAAVYGLMFLTAWF